jgi:hypothetical protein
MVKITEGIADVKTETKAILYFLLSHVRAARSAEKESDGLGRMSRRYNTDFREHHSGINVKENRVE